MFTTTLKMVIFLVTMASRCPAGLGNSVPKQYGGRNFIQGVLSDLGCTPDEEKISINHDVVDHSTQFGIHVHDGFHLAYCNCNCHNDQRTLNATESLREMITRHYLQEVDWRRRTAQGDQKVYTYIIHVHEKLSKQLRQIQRRTKQMLRMLQWVGQSYIERIVNHPFSITSSMDVSGSFVLKK